MAQLERPRRVGGRRQRVVHQRGREPLTGLVVRQLHVERVGNALHDAAVNLAVDDGRLQHVPAVVRDDPPQDVDGARLPNVPPPRAISAVSPVRTSIVAGSIPRRSPTRWENIVTCPRPWGAAPLTTMTPPLGSTRTMALSFGAVAVAST